MFSTHLVLQAMIIKGRFLCGIFLYTACVPTMHIAQLIGGIGGSLVVQGKGVIFSCRQIKLNSTPSHIRLLSVPYKRGLRFEVTGRCRFIVYISTPCSILAYVF